MADNSTRDILNILRNLNESVANEKERSLLKEEVEKTAVAITDDPKFGDHVLTNQIDQFRSAVEGGAQFSINKEGNASENPLIYLPKDNNLIFSGIIPCLNNLKWQFVLKTNTGSGCFIWSDGMILNKDNLQILNKLQAFYVNWRDEWNQDYKNLEQLGNIN